MRDRGIEPRSPGWKPGILPLDQSRSAILIEGEIYWCQIYRCQFFFSAKNMF